MRVFIFFLLLLISNNIFSQKVNILKESKKLYKKGNFQEALTSIEIIEKNISDAQQLSSCDQLSLFHWLCHPKC